MLIKVKAYPGAKNQEIVKNRQDSYEVWVKAPPRQGQANREIRQALAKYFNLSLDQIRLVRGFNQSNKLFEIKKGI